VAAPGFAFETEEAFTGDEADVAGIAGVADVVVGAVLEDGGDERGVASEVVEERAETEAGDGALFTRGFLQEAQRIARTTPLDRPFS